jgi:VanZ family protein
MPSLTNLLHDSRYHRSWGALLLVLMAVVSWFAFVPDPGGSGIAHIDKVKHLLAFGALGFAAALAGHNQSLRLQRVMLALLAYGLFIEVVQSYLPSRRGDWQDLLADAAGIALGMTLVAALRKHWASKPDQQ